MATGPRYRVAFKRRRKGKTDYRQRRSLVISGIPRMVTRGSLKNISIQLIKAEVSGDKVIVSAHSNELAKKYGWQGGGSSLPVAYLTGLLCGYKANANGIKVVTLDMGLQAPSKGARVFAALRGVLDAGVVVPHDKKKLPDEKRIQGVHIAEYAKKLSSAQDMYQKQFSGQLSRGLRPEEITEHFSQVKQKLVSSFSKAEVFEGKKTQRGKEKATRKISESKKVLRKKVIAKKTSRPRVKKSKELEKSEEIK